MQLDLLILALVLPLATSLGIPKGSTYRYATEHDTLTIPAGPQVGPNPDLGSNRPTEHTGVSSWADIVSGTRESDGGEQTLASHHGPQVLKVPMAAAVGVNLVPITIDGAGVEMMKAGKGKRDPCVMSGDGYAIVLKNRAAAFFRSIGHEARLVFSSKVEARKEATVESQPTKFLAALETFSTTGCDARDNDILVLRDTACADLDDRGSLRVFAHNSSLKYNSLRVFKTENCTGGWTLQPLNDACSDVSAFKSIRVVLD